MIPDYLYARSYNSETYHCAHFAAELFEHLTGNDIRPYIISTLDPVEDASVDFMSRRYFRRIKTPVNPCLVTIRLPGSGLHVGVYTNGNVAQLSDTGVMCTEVGSVPGKKAFYEYVGNS